MGASCEFAWPSGATSALSLTFDGAHPEHLELVVPLLAEMGVRATFFVTVAGLLDAPEKWRRIVQAGHEIGSHCFYGISHDGDLPAWTLDMIRDDLRLADKGIVEILECPATSFAMPGKSVTCAQGEYAAIVNKQFSAVRSAENGFNHSPEVDLTQVQCLAWRDLVGPVESLLPEPGSWSVPVFEQFFGLEFGTAEDDLRVLLGHLSHRTDVWVAPFGEVAAFISEAKAVKAKPSGN